ncbi:uridine 5'-monophosphate kinase [Candidatus Blochmanniella floridana]|uniref:Uridylate kinase n=1 Tax=Blochmanniella floridana TaxID=203907 RepID=PYRH_BLOFL|nr:RecName: Full=Uridylate kinase; Short=UK; AltName: Full=Uridine monophosphate kinase; Short=UMP kinase; Short=UMPK [Candidatus Blochmannia floridanus]CAD83344.1 uridine 5'-monophosphate kinase [Candidatus Blochmannia floridanus]
MEYKINPIYRRIMLKISGEALQGTENFGVDSSILDRMVLEIKELVNIGVQIGMIIGGGNLFRGSRLVQFGMNKVIGDHIGMLATIMNGLVMHNALHRVYVDSSVMSAIPLQGVCDNYNWMRAIDLLSNNKVVIFGAGTGNPFFTTDSAACLRGIEISANAVFKATKVDGVFAHDPIQYPNHNIALYEQLSYQDVLQRELKVMDLTAFALARDHNLPIHIFNINKVGALKRIIMGYREGTVITK